MNLYVDDHRSCPPGWEIARTVNEAVRLLAESLADGEQIEEISLDYNIEYHVEMPGLPARVKVESPETFAAVARFLALMPAEKRPVVLYHTDDPQGEAELRSIMIGAEVEGLIG